MRTSQIVGTFFVHEGAAGRAMLGIAAAKRGSFEGLQQRWSALFAVQRPAWLPCPPAVSSSRKTLSPLRTDAVLPPLNALHPAPCAAPALPAPLRDLELVAQLDLKLIYGVNTHCHADHITGDEAPGCPTTPLFERTP